MTQTPTTSRPTTSRPPELSSHMPRDAIARPQGRALMASNSYTVSGTTPAGVRFRKTFSRKRHGADFRQIAEEYRRRQLFEIQPKSTNISARITFADLAARYQTEYLPETRSAKTAAAPIKIITQKWGEYRLAHITREAVRPWVRQLFKAGDIKPSYVNSILIYFVAILNWACEEGIISTNPLDHLRDRKTRKLFKRGMHPRRKSMTETDFFRIVSIMPVKAGRIAAIAWYTGMRRAEVAGLRWEQVEGDIVVFSSDEVKEIAEKRVPLESGARAILTEIQTEQLTSGRQSDFVFPGRGGRKPITLDYVSEQFHDAAIKADLPGFVFHDSRHFFRQRKRREGFGRELIKAAMGHHSDAMSDRYDNFTDDDLRGLAEIGRNPKRPNGTHE